MLRCTPTDIVRSIALSALLTLAAPTGSLHAAPLDFNRDIRPILSENCFRCHGPDKNTRKAKLRLDVESEAKANLNGHRTIYPGKPESSELITRILSADPDTVMPPPRSEKSLTPAQKQTLQEWISQGAPYAGHWSFTRLSRPTPPAVAPPSTSPLPSLASPPRTAASSSSANTWNPIDRFIQQRWASEQITGSPEADRATLIRRLSLDLTGIPPSPNEVRQFQSSRDPLAYERLVDRLITSPRFAERLTAHWLDLVRYADSIGYHGDVTYSVWPYRDYVLKAFHQNMPFDQFTREQIAGDLLPNASPLQQTASTYNRLNRISTEGGAQDKEYLAKYAADRVRTTSTIWLGATMGCAECHDHKYDPYTTRDFYQFAAFFADLKEKGFYDDGFSKNDWGPKILLPSPSQQRQLKALDRQILSLQSQIDASPDAHLAAPRLAWESRVKVLDDASQLEWRTQKPSHVSTDHGADLTVGTNRAVTASGPNPDRESYHIRFQPGPGRWTGLRLETLTDEVFPGNRIARSGTSFHITEVELALQDSQSSTPKRLAFQHVLADHEGDGFPPRAMIDGQSTTSWSITTGHSREHQAAFWLPNPILTTADTTLIVTLHHNSIYPQTTVGKFRLSLSALESPTHDKSGLPDDVLKALRAPLSERSEAQIKLVTQLYREVAPELASLRSRLESLKYQRSLLVGQIPSTLVSEATAPRPMRVLPRGNWMDDSGDPLTPAVPHFLPQLTKSSDRPSRLDLANWFTSDSNPLAARAFVNRLWRIFFGTGLSKTLEDLGSQGEWPSHPELLDWLASEFVTPSTSIPASSTLTHRWDVKHLVRLIVTSQTYRQTSTPRPGLDEKDPYNRLLARQNKLRLDAEIIRDNALAISGLLHESFGGPSAHPYQPRGYFAALNFPKREYVESRGPSLYRRGLYSHWQRTFLHPSLSAFDAPAREECTVNRTPSNTPLQALVLLNDTTYVEAARALAHQILRSKPRSPSHGVESAFWRTLGRAPSPEETSTLIQLLQSQELFFTQNPDAATDLIALGESKSPPHLNPITLASWTAVTRTLLNLHETITRP